MKTSIRFGRSAAIAIVALALAAPLAAAAQPPDVQIAAGPLGPTLTLGDVAAANSIAVVFQEKNFSYMRWSTDGGATFAPKAALRGGLRAKDPRVASCGDMIWASSTWQSDENKNVGVDYRDAALGTTGRFSLGMGQKTDVACFGNAVAVTWWLNDHVFMAISDGQCGNPCVPAFSYDLGPASFDSPARVATDGTGFVVSWIRNPDALDEALTIQHFQLSNAGGLNVMADPVVMLMPGKTLYSPVVAGDGSRVVVAYSRLGQTHMRISEDHGQSFGPRIIVSKYCRDCPEGGSYPDSVDVRDGLILVEVIKGGGTPPAFSANGFLTHNDGNRFTKTPRHVGGFQFGVLRDGSLAEAWDDHFYNTWPYNQPQEIGFHVRNLNSVGGLVRRWWRATPR